MLILSAQSLEPKWLRTVAAYHKVKTDNDKVVNFDIIRDMVLNTYDTANVASESR